MLRSNLIKELLKSIMTDVISDKFIVYTDGACRNNGKATAISSIGIYFSNRNLKKIDNISEILKVSDVLKISKHTNNIAELSAINKSLSLIKDNGIKLPIYLYTDSEYSLNVLTKWYPKWTEKQKQTKKNIPLIKDTYELCMDVNPKFHHIKAHTNLDDEHSLGNAIADQLANDALDKFDKGDKGILKYFQ